MGPQMNADKQDMSRYLFTSAFILLNIRVYARAIPGSPSHTLGTASRRSAVQFLLSAKLSADTESYSGGGFGGAFDGIGEMTCQTFNLHSIAALDHDTHHGLGARGAQYHAPVIRQLAFDLLDGLLHTR